MNTELIKKIVKYVAEHPEVYNPSVPHADVCFALQLQDIASSLKDVTAAKAILGLTDDEAEELFCADNNEVIELVRKYAGL